MLNIFKKKKKDEHNIMSKDCKTNLKKHHCQIIRKKKLERGSEKKREERNFVGDYLKL